MTTCWSSNTRAGLGSSLSVRIMSIFVSFSYNNPRAGDKYMSISLGAFFFHSFQDNIMHFRSEVYTRTITTILSREMKWVNLLRQYTSYLINCGAIRHLINFLTKFTLMINTLMSGGKNFVRLIRVISSFYYKYDS